MNKQLWDKCVEFHGHECPGLAIGFKACEAAVEKLGITFSKDEEVVCVTENDACGVDAIQVITGCSMDKGNLLYRSTGKQAYSFFNRTTGESIRLVLKPFKGDIFSTVFCEQCGEGSPEHKIRLQDGKKIYQDCFEEYSRGW